MTDPSKDCSFLPDMNTFGEKREGWNWLSWMYDGGVYKNDADEYVQGVPYYFSRVIVRHGDKMIGDAVVLSEPLPEGEALKAMLEAHREIVDMSVADLIKKLAAAEAKIFNVRLLIKQNEDDFYRSVSCAELEEALADTEAHNGE